MSHPKTYPESHPGTQPTKSSSTLLEAPDPSVQLGPLPSGTRRRGIFSRLAARRAAAVLAVALVAVGLGMLVYAPATDFYAARAQARLRRQFAADVTAAAAGPTGPVPTSQALAVVRIPAIGLDAVVVQGTDPQSLRTGPGHYAQSPLPCLPGNVAVAGHRTTYGHWFNRLDELAAGDDITFVTPSGSCTYQALAAPAATPVPHAGSAAWIISPDDWGVVGPLTGSYLTLTTCNPKGSAAQRLVARARLVSAISDR